MRKICRRLGIAALLTISVVEFSGCNSRSLATSLRIPGRKDRSEEVAEKPTQAQKDRAAELLAEARQHERDGDFPNATRAYREYLNSGGKPLKDSPMSHSGSVAELERQSHDRSASFQSSQDSADDSEEQEEPSKGRNRFLPGRKAKSQDRKHIAATRPTEDPWATQNEPEVKTAEAEVETVPHKARHKDSSLADSGDSNPTTSDSDEPVEESPSDSRITEDAIAELMDLDEGAIDWGDTSSEPLVAKTSDITHDSDVADDSETSDLNATEEEPVDHQMVSQSDSSSEDWALDDEVGEPQTGDLGSSEEEQLAHVETADALDSPIADDEDHAPAADESKFAAECRHCDPWVYAQVMKLESQNPDVRTEGLVNLADMGINARDASNAIRSLLQDPEPLVQANAAWALWRVDETSTESVDALVPLLAHSSPEVVELACFILGDIGPEAESAIKALEDVQTEAVGSTRIQAAEALVRIQKDPKSSVQLLVDALDSRDGGERWLAAVALGRCQGDYSADVVTVLTEALKDSDPEVRSAAALSLGAYGQDAIDATEELQRVAHSDDETVREAAIAALACLKAE